MAVWFANTSNMDPEDRAKFQRLLEILDDLNHRLFDVEEALSALSTSVPEFVELTSKKDRLISLLQEIHNAACLIAHRYGQ